MEQHQLSGSVSATEFKKSKASLVKAFNQKGRFYTEYFLGYCSIHYKHYENLGVYRKLQLPTLEEIPTFNIQNDIYSSKNWNSF